MPNSIRPLDANTEPQGCNFQSAARRWNCSVHTLKRAESHGMIKTIQFGDRSIIPPAEVARIDNEGLGRIPAGYIRKTTGPWPGGRKRGSKVKAGKAKAAGKTAPPRRSRRSEVRAPA